MNDMTLFLQLLGKELEAQGVEISFRQPPEWDEAFWRELGETRRTAERAALDAIAACLREDTDDFTCVDRILHILEMLGYSTVPRHDFG